MRATVKDIKRVVQFNSVNRVKVTLYADPTVSWYANTQNFHEMLEELGYVNLSLSFI